MIAINLSNNYFRKRKCEIVDDVYSSYQANETDFSKEFIEDTSNQIAVKNLMDKLPDDQKVVVWLRYYENAKFEEISKILHIPKSITSSNKENE